MGEDALEHQAAETPCAADVQTSHKHLRAITMQYNSLHLHALLMLFSNVQQTVTTE